MSSSAVTDLARLEEAERKAAEIEERRKKAPEDAALGIEHARALYRASLHDPDPRSAGARLEKALELDPYSGPAWFRVGLLRHRTGNAPNAVKAYQRALACSPKHPKVLYHLALAATARGGEEGMREAEEAIASLLELRPGFVPALLARVECLVRKNPKKDRAQTQATIQGSLSAIPIRREWRQAVVEKLLKFLFGHGGGEAEKAVVAEVTRPWREAEPEAPEWPLLDAAADLAAGPYDAVVEALPAWAARLRGSLVLDVFLNGLAPSVGGKDAPPEQVLAAREERVRGWIAKCPEHAGFALELAWILHLRAKRHLREAQYVEARNLWLEAGRSDPYSPTLRQNLALLASFTRDAREYKNHWERLYRLWRSYALILPEGNPYGELPLLRHLALGCTLFRVNAQDITELKTLDRRYLQFCMRELDQYLVVSRFRSENPWVILGEDPSAPNAAVADKRIRRTINRIINTNVFDDNTQAISRFDAYLARLDEARRRSARTALSPAERRVLSLLNGKHGQLIMRCSQLECALQDAAIRFSQAPVDGKSPTDRRGIEALEGMAHDLWQYVVQSVNTNALPNDPLAYYTLARVEYHEESRHMQRHGASTNKEPVAEAWWETRSPKVDVPRARRPEAAAGGALGAREIDLLNRAKAAIENSKVPPSIRQLVLAAASAVLAALQGGPGGLAEPLKNLEIVLALAEALA